MTADVLHRAVQLDAQHADVGLGLVDASVVAVAEAVGATRVATLDHAHLRVVQAQGWELMPSEHDL